MVKQTTYRWITAGVLALILILIGAVLYVNGGFGLDSSSSARTAVEEFGLQLQTVSLLDESASSTMASAYGSLVTSDLLQRWQQDPENAPGRLTSSPYPDRIEISAIVKQGRGYIVQGEIVMMTSTSESSRTPVILQVIPQDGAWLIAVYQEPNTGEE